MMCKFIYRYLPLLVFMNWDFDFSQWYAGKFPNFVSLCNSFDSDCPEFCMALAATE